jgi:hypothetical protein
MEHWDISCNDKMPQLYGAGKEPGEWFRQYRMMRCENGLQRACGTATPDLIAGLANTGYHRASLPPDSTPS